jgi:hypothetical protein
MCHVRDAQKAFATQLFAELQRLNHILVVELRHSFNSSQAHRLFCLVLVTLLASITTFTMFSQLLKVVVPTTLLLSLAESAVLPSRELSRRDVAGYTYGGCFTEATNQRAFTGNAYFDDLWVSILGYWQKLTVRKE